MISRMKKDDVIVIGARNRAAYLLQQYGYTMGIAREEAADLIPHLTPTYLDEVDACAESLREAQKSRVAAEEESKSSTQQVNDVMVRAKSWRAAVVNRAKKARYMGIEVPAGLCRTNGAAGVADVAVQIDSMVKLLQTDGERLPGTPIEKVIRTGKELADAVRSLDQAQEVKRLSGLPAAVRDFYYNKGLLYLGIKAINEAGRELHSGDKAAAARYDLSILHRHAGRKKESDEIASPGGKG